MTQAGARQVLVDLLRRAYSGELAAALAYRGHARSVRDPDERRQLRAIEAEERAHRLRVGAMLRDLGEEPSALREHLFLVMGHVIAALCHVTGWLAPMLGAGWLERGNIHEYERAARAAWNSGNPQLVEDLLEMAAVEHDHEGYFRLRVRTHWLGRWLPLWSHPPPRASILASFDRFRNDLAS